MVLAMGWTIINDFDAISAYPRIQKTPKKVWLNECDYLDVQSKNEILYTPNAAVCTGIAILPVGQSGLAGLIHFYSTMDFFLNGQEGLERHVDVMWHAFIKPFDARTKYHAVIFGGVDDVPEEKRAGLTKDMVAQYFSDIDRYAAIIDSKEYRQISIDVEALIARQLDMPRAEYLKKLDDLRILRNTMKSDLVDLFEKKSGVDPSNDIARVVSNWIGNRAHTLLRQSHMIDHVTDLRHQGTPQDCIIHPQTRDVLVYPGTLHEKIVSAPTMASARKLAPTQRLVA